jgi:bacterioferritin-associated ferredoxin
MFMCICNSISALDLSKLVKEGKVISVQDIKPKCGSCTKKIEDHIKSVKGK